MVSTSNLPALVADQQGGVPGVDAAQVRVAGVPKLVVDAVGNVGIGTAVPRKTAHVQGDLVVTGLLYDSNLNSMWIPGSTVRWLATPAPPVLTPATGGAVAVTASNASYRYVGTDVSYQIQLAGAVTAQPTNLNADYLLSLPQPVDGARYPQPTTIGELWLNVYNGASSNAFKAYARTTAASASNAAVRFLSGSTDAGLGYMAVGSTWTLAGTLTYVTPLLNNMNGIPVAYTPAAFAQNQVGQVAFNTGGNPPRGQFDVMCTSNVPALVVDARGGGAIAHIPL